MPIRVGLKTQYDRLLYHLNHLTDDMRHLETQLASGKKYTKPSDNPVDLVQSLSYRKALEEIKRYQVSIREGKSFLRTMEGALQSFKKVVERAKVLALQGANDIQNETTRKAIAAEIEGLLEEALALANTQHGNRYVFAGNAPIGKKPFKLIKESLPNGNILEKVIYQGGIEDLYQGYAPERKILISRNGEQALMASEVFQSLITLKKTLENNNLVDPYKEIENIQNHIKRLDKVLDHLVAERADLGTRVDHLELKANIYDNLEDTLIGNLGETEEVDYLEAISRLSARKTAYEATLKAASLTMGLSLVKYL